MSNDIYRLPDLAYDYAALEPHYSARTLELHHSKHHATYVKQANETLDRIAERRGAAPDPLIARGLRKALAFNVSGHLLHSIFWTSACTAAVRKLFGPPWLRRRRVVELLE